jgi:hypothetical protein
VGQARPMRLRYTLPALADLTSILDYIAERSPQANEYCPSSSTVVRQISTLKQ